MEKYASQLLADAKQFIDENPRVLKGLLAGGGVGALGGALTTLATQSPDEETTGQKAKRVLKNALIGGAMGAGAGGMLTSSWEEGKTALPVQDVSPIDKAVTSNTARGASALGAGGLATWQSLRSSRKELADTFAAFNRGKNGYTINTRADLVRKLNDIGKNMRGDEARAIQQALGGSADNIMSKLTSLGIDAKAFRSMVTGASKGKLKDVINTQRSLPLVGTMGANSKYAQYLSKILANPNSKRMPKLLALLQTKALNAAPATVGLIKRHPGIAAATAAGVLLPEIAQALRYGYNTITE